MEAFFLLEQLIAGEGVPLLWCKNQALIRSLVELKKLAEPGFRRMSSALITRSILDGYFNHLVFWYQWDYLWLFRSMAISGTDSLQAPTIYIYKAFFKGLCKGISQQHGLIWYSTSILGFRIVKFPLIGWVL